MTYEDFIRQFPTYASLAALLRDQLDDEDLRLFEPKKIVPPGGYDTPKTIAGALSMTIGENVLKLRDKETVRPLEITAMSIAYQIVDEHVPVYYVADQFCRAVADTDLPDGFTLQELKWPVPALVLGFPPKFMREYIGMDTCYVFCARTDAGEHRCHALPHLPHTLLPKDRVAWFWSSMQSGKQPEMFVSSYFRDDQINETLHKYAYTDYTQAPPEVVNTNKEATDKVSALILKLLCVLNWRDSLVEPGHCIRAARVKKGKMQSELWSASFIGGSYRLLRETKDGGHSSPRLHRRRGHWTYQTIGKKEDFVSITELPRTEAGTINWTTVDEPLREKFFKSHKRIWLEPVWIGL